MSQKLIWLKASFVFLLICLIWLGFILAMVRTFDPFDKNGLWILTHFAYPLATFWISVFLAKGTRLPLAPKTIWLCGLIYSVMAVAYYVIAWQPSVVMARDPDNAGAIALIMLASSSMRLLFCLGQTWATLNIANRLFVKTLDTFGNPIVSGDSA